MSTKHDLWTSFVPFPYSGTAILSALLGVVLPPVINYGYGKEDAAKQAAEKAANSSSYSWRNPWDARYM